MPIIIKFCRYTVRGRVFRNKNKLKGENVSITENLTKERVSELKWARKLHGFRNVWLQDAMVKFIFECQFSKSISQYKKYVDHVSTKWNASPTWLKFGDLLTSYCGLHKWGTSELVCPRKLKARCHFHFVCSLIKTSNHEFAEG